MAAVTVRNLSPEVHRALKARAALHGRSTEAEIREILKNAVLSEEEIGLGSELEAFGRKHGGLNLEVELEEDSLVPANFE